jgi:ABC-type transporter Mla maintaining outer membrane lipid asymmetry ATPase subunit MlaF
MLEDGLIHFQGTPGELQNSTDPIVQEFIERYALSHTATNLEQRP